MPQFARPAVDLVTTGWRRETEESGTAQAGAASSITLAADESGTDDFYNGKKIDIVAGTGSGQTRTITDYVGSTKEATVDTAWTTVPDSTSGYEIYDAELFEGIDESVLDTLDFIQSPVSPTSANPYETRLSAITDPNSTSAHTLRINCRKDFEGGARIDMTMEFYDESTDPDTLISSITATNLTNLDGAIEDLLTTAEINSITAAAYAGQLRVKHWYTEVA